MRRFFGQVIVLAIVSMSMAGCIKDISTAPSLSSPVPFSGTYTGTTTHTADPFVNQLAGTGSSPSLGQGTNQGTVVITGFDDKTCVGGITNLQYYTLTAANGDTVVLINSDLACPTATPGVYRGTGKWEVTRGTGRFSGATGRGTLDGQTDLVALKYSIALSGTISTPQ